MSRQYIDCREYPSEMNCSVALSADNQQELLEAAVQHAVAGHGASAAGAGQGGVVRAGQRPQDLGPARMHFFAYK